MITSFFFLLACFSTTSVPCTLVSIVCTGRSTISFTPTAAARWKTTSLRSIHSASSGSLSMVSITYEKPGILFRCEMFSMDPVDRLSMIPTSCPRCSSCSARWDPMNPAPPVISAFIVVLAAESGRSVSFREYAHMPRDASDVGIRQPRVQRERQQFRCREGCHGTRHGLVWSEGLLFRQRHRVVNQGSDTGLREVSAQLVSGGNAHRKKMVHVSGIAFADW